MLQLLHTCSCWFSAQTAWNGSSLQQSDTGTSRANPSVSLGRNFSLLSHPWSQSCFLSPLVLSWLLFLRDQIQARMFLQWPRLHQSSPNTFLLHGMNFCLRLSGLLTLTVRTAGFSNSFCHRFLHDTGKPATPLCLSFSFCDGAPNSSPTVLIVKIITFTSPSECYRKAQEKEMYVGTCTIQAAPPSRPQLCGNHCL